MYKSTRKSLEDFIREGKELYGDLASYDKVVYVNNKTPVLLTCNEHHIDFLQRPDNFLQGRFGCPECRKKHTKETRWRNHGTFIDACNRKFNNKFTYGEYVNNDTPMDVTCPDHGTFKTKPLAHYQSKYGCPECAKEHMNHEPRNKKTTEQFIQEANEVHHGKYDYSKTVYTGKDEKVIVICPDHGEFEQIAKNHLRGHGCPKCSGMHHYTTEEWVEMAKSAHPEENLSFENTVYVNNKTKLRVDCSEHGPFWVAPNDFISGTGCPKCHTERFAQQRSLPFVEYVRRANEIHNNKYTYIEDDYKNLNTLSTIICDIHGPFKQKPSNHLNGQGCPLCAPKSKMEVDIADLLETNHINFRKEKSFDWSQRKRYDFYLPDYGLCIECQGPQHFRPTRFHTNQDPVEVYEANKVNDELKLRMCQDNGLDLLYFTDVDMDEYPYRVFKDENELLNEILSHKKLENGTC